MNERIKQLAEQASKLAREEHPEIANRATIGQIANAKFKSYIVTEFDMEKFAELIIKECVNVLDPNGEYTEKYKYSHIPGPDGLRTLLSHEQYYEMMASKKIKQNFGVE